MNLKNFFSAKPEPPAAAPTAQPMCVAGHALDPHWGGVCPYCEAIVRGRAKTASTLRVDPDATVVDRTTPAPAVSPATGRVTRTAASAGADAGHEPAPETRRITAVLVSFSAHATGTLFALREGRNTIGRGGASAARRCEVEVPHDAGMAPEQALIISRAGRHELVEVGEGGRTALDGAPIDARVVELTDHCTIGIGTTVFEFVRVDGGPVVASRVGAASNAGHDDPDRTVIA